MTTSFRTYNQVGGFQNHVLNQFKYSLKSLIVATSLYYEATITQQETELQLHSETPFL